MITLHGYRPSVYTRAARLGLHLRGLDYRFRDIDPFELPVAPDYLALHPFGRVPVLDHDGFVLHETRAILTYLATAFPGPALIPAAPQTRARMEQVLSILDAYGYWPLVRQVYSHAVFRPAMGAPSDPALITAGMQAARPVLTALELIAATGPLLSGRTLTLADLLLAPMIAAFVQHPHAAKLLAAHPGLARWWSHMAGHAIMTATSTPQPLPLPPTGDPT